MKFIILAAIACMLVAGCVSEFSVIDNNFVGRSPLDITYYYSPSCGYCTQVSADFENLTTYYNEDFEITKYDVSKGVVAEFNDARVKYNNSGGYIPFIVVENVAFIGYTEDTQFKIAEMIENRK